MKEGLFEHKDFSVHVSTNAYGLRDKEYSLAKGEGKKRILMLGDSMGWGFGVEQEEMIDAIIESKYDNIEFINSSVAGYGTDQQYLYLKHRGMMLQPDLVILLFHPNDFYNNAHPKQYGYAKPVFKLKEKELVLQNSPVPYYWEDAVVRFIVNKTYFFRQLYLAIGGLIPYMRDSHTSSIDDPDLVFDVTRLLLLEIKHITDLKGIDFWVVGIPGKDGKASKIVDNVEDFIKSQGIQYISLEKVFSQSTEETMFNHTQHWNAYGQRLAAEVLEKALLATEYLTSK